MLLFKLFILFSLIAKVGKRVKKIIICYVLAGILLSQYFVCKNKIEKKYSF